MVSVVRLSKDGAVAPREGCTLLQLLSGNRKEVSVGRGKHVTRKGGDWLAEEELVTSVGRNPVSEERS